MKLTRKLMVKACMESMECRLGQRSLGRRVEPLRMELSTIKNGNQNSPLYVVEKQMLFIVSTARCAKKMLAVVIKVFLMLKGMSNVVVNY